jgi:hypothetical protein
MLSGVAATGSSIPYAAITVEDKTGTTVSATADGNGAFSVDVHGMTAPLLLKASALNGNLVVYGFALNSDIGGSVGLNPLTTLLLADAASTTPQTLFDNYTTFVADPSNLVAAFLNNLPTAKASLFTAFAPIQSALGTTVTQDQLFGSFAADHTGVDRILDSLNISVAGSYQGPSGPVAPGPDPFTNLVTTVALSDKLGTAAADTVFSNVSVTPGTTPTFTVTAGLAESASVSASIATMLGSLTTACSNTASPSSACLALFTNTFSQNSQNATQWLQTNSANSTASVVTYRFLSLDAKATSATYDASFLVSTTVNGVTTTQLGHGVFSTDGTSWYLAG